MTDQPSPEQQQASYPDFAVTAEGIRRLHEAFGRAAHALIEKDAQLADERQKAARIFDLSTRMQQECARDHVMKPAEAPPEPAPADPEGG